MEGAKRSRMAQSRAPSSNGAAAVDVKPSLYGDVFGSGPPGKWPPTAHSATPPRPSDYAEIFGGFHASCAIPVLDLPPAADDTQDLFRSCFALDYLDIFGGLDAAGFGVSYEDLFIGHQRNEGRRRPPEDERNDVGTNLQPSAVSDSFVMELESAHATSLEKNQSSPIRIITCGLNNGKMHANGTSRDNAIDMRTSAAEVCAVTEFAFMGNACPPSLMNTGNSPGCPTNMNSDKNSVLHDEIYPSYSKNLGSTHASCCSAGDSGNNQASDEKHSTVKSNHEDISASELYHSCSSDNSNDEDSSFNEPLTDDGSVTSAVYDEIIKDDCFKRETEAVPASSVKFKNDLSADQKKSDISTAAEKFPCGISTSQLNYDHGQNSGMYIKKTNRELSEENALPISDGSMKISGKVLGDNKQQLQAFSNMPSSTDGAFLTVFDINLQTQPSQLPPPSRPPPRLTPDQVNYRMGKTTLLKVHLDESGNGPATNYQMKRVSRIPEFQTQKRTGKGSSPPFYDVEFDASSAAAASVAAVKEAMEQAEAKLKRTKESMVRKKDNIQTKRKLGISESSKFKEMGVIESAVTQSFSDVLMPKIAIENNHERNVSAAKQVEKVAVMDKAVPYNQEEEKHFNLAQKSLRYMQDNEQGFPIEVERADEWKVDKQFFELVNSDNKLKKAHEVSIQGDEKRKSKAFISAKDEKDEKCTLTRLAGNLEHNDKVRDAYMIFKTADDDKRLKEAHQAVGIIDVTKANNEKSREDSMDTSIKEVDAAHKTDPEEPACEDGAEPKVESDSHQPGKVHFRQEGEDVSNGAVQKDFETKVEACSRIEARHSLKSDDKDYNCKEVPKNLVKEKQSEFCEAIKFEEVHGSVIKGKKSGALEETSVFQGGMKEINEANSNCNPIDIAMKLTAGIESMQHLENNEELVEHLVAQSCWEKAETKGPEETVTTTESTFYDEETELTVEQTAMAPEQDEIKDLKDTKNSCKDEENENAFREPCRSEENNRNISLDEDAETCSKTVEGKETKDEHWQYLCEKLIKECEIELHPSEEKQEASKAGCENVSGKESMGCLSVDEMRKNEGSDDFKMESELKIKNYKCAADEFYKSGQSEEKLEDAEASSSHHSNGLPKASQRISNPSNPEVLGRRIPEILKNREALGEEKNKTEIEQEKEKARKFQEEREREREREKDRVAFEKTTLESHERAFTEALERAERAAVERVTAEARQRALAEAQLKAEKALADALSSSEKAAKEARLRAERAAVDRANTEARERAAERALAEQAAREARAERSTTSNWQRKNSGVDGNAKFPSKDNQGMKTSTNYHDKYDFSRESQRHSDSSNHVPRPKEKLSGHEGESAIRSRARWERHQRTSERAAKALVEKNLRDIIAQREQAERNRLSESLDADVRRWSTGKEGNLRALLSTLQYILGPESGWQPIPLTDVITAADVKKAYRKATLCVHPDKLQQRGANIQQKYVCEKVFDLLKDAWNGFNSEER